MPLPKLIEVVPFSAEQLAQFKATKAEIVIPGSKSITNRALVLAAQATGMVTLKGALWSEDTEAMTDCMHRLGVEVDVAADPEVAANRILTVKGCGGKLPKGGTEAEPLELFVANAGTAARFLTAMVCLGDGVYRVGGWQVALSEGADPDELPYVEMTRQMTATFPHSGGTFQIEPDASSASYFHAANALFPGVAPVRVMACQPPKADGGTGWQIDAEYPRLTPVAADLNVSHTALSGEKYLEAHGVKEALAEAVAEVLRTRPADPLSAINGILSVREESAAKRRKVTVSRKALIH